MSDAAGIVREEVLTRGRDDRLDYVIEAQRPFDDLRDVVAQVAGLLVLAGSNSRFAGADHPMLLVALERWRAATDALQSLSPGQAGLHHHRHLSLGAERLGEALNQLRALRGRNEGVGRSLGLLKAAWQEIIHASTALPGFHTVDLSQSCCAAHARIRRGSP